MSQQSGMVDVSYLLSQSVPLEVRREHEGRLVRRYLEGLVAAGVTSYPLEDALRQYRIGVAFNLVWALLSKRPTFLLQQPYLAV